MHRASNSLNESEAGRLLALRFGPFELDVKSGELRRNGTTVRLQPQPLKVLLLLLGRPGQVVTREEIQGEIWPAGTFVDFEQSLNFCIRQIRAALRDDANAPRFIETLPRRGYRWVAGPVQPELAPAVVHEWPRPIGEPVPGAAPGAAPTVDASSGPAGVATTQVVSASGPVSTASGPAAVPAAASRWLLPLALASLAVAIVAVAALALRGRSAEPAAPSPTFQRITFRRGALNTARFAPDGRIVYSAAWEGSPRQMFVAGSNPGDALALDVRDARLVGVSAVGEISFLRGGTLARAALAGGPAKEMLTEVVAADWSEDGKDLVVVRSGANGHKLEFPAGTVVFETSSRLLGIRLSPDRRIVAVTEHPILGDDRGRVLIVDRAGKTVAKSVEFASLNGIAWAPGGREVFFTASEVGADNSLRALGVDGHARQVLDSTGRLVVHDVAPDGRVLLERTTLRTEMMHRRASDKEDRELSWLDYSGSVALSSDGKTVLFYESGEGAGAEYATYLRGFDGSPPVRVGSGRALDLSPDGSLVLTVDIRDPSAIDVTPTGPGQARKLRIASLVAHEDGGFLADGRRVFVMGRQDSGVRSTWLTDLDGSTPRELPLPPGRFLAQNTFSSDGSRFVADCPDGKYPCLYDTERGDPKVVPGTEPGWMGVAIDRRGRLYFRDRTPWRVEKLYRVENGRATVLGELAPRDRAGAAGMLDVAVSADGEAWVYTFLRRLSELHVVSGIH